MPTRFNGGSPVSDTSNPFSNGVGNQAGADADILPSLDVNGHEAAAATDLDGYGAASPKGDAQRPESPNSWPK